MLVLDDRSGQDQPEKKHRTFFALWPDDETRAQLDVQAERLAAELGSGVRRMRTENLHITLVFLGDVNAAQTAKARQLASEIESESFMLRMEAYGYFQRPKVLFSEAKVVPEAAGNLQQRLYQSLESAGYKLDTRPWHPHMTLFRKVTAEQAEQALASTECPAYDWPVQSFSLLQSIQSAAGVRYQEVDRWYLSSVPSMSQSI